MQYNILIEDDSESMDEISILEKIIQEEGSCTWSRPSICKNCPLGKILRPDGNGYMSCIESMGIDGLSEEEADAKYKAAAINKLADLMIHSAIEEKDGSE